LGGDARDRALWVAERPLDTCRLATGWRRNRQGERSGRSAGHGCRSEGKGCGASLDPESQREEDKANSVKGQHLWLHCKHPERIAAQRSRNTTTLSTRFATKYQSVAQKVLVRARIIVINHTIKALPCDQMITLRANSCAGGTKGSSGEAVIVPQPGQGRTLRISLFRQPTKGGGLLGASGISGDRTVIPKKT
jgi:hypothetical protein